LTRRHDRQEDLREPGNGVHDDQGPSRPSGNRKAVREVDFPYEYSVADYAASEVLGLRGRKVRIVPLTFRMDSRNAELPETSQAR
jgi:hypothetical protein